MGLLPKHLRDNIVNVTISLVKTLQSIMSTFGKNKGMLNLSVTIDQESGFCFGVVYAIEMAEEILEEQGYLYCLGDIVHNDEEVERLKLKGLRIINHDEFKELKKIKKMSVYLFAHMVNLLQPIKLL